MPGKQRFFLECPFSEKEMAKSLGAKWDASAKKWFVPDALDTDLFRKWWPSACDRAMATTPKLQIERLYLDCAFHEKDEVKRLGAKWDEGKRRWYIPEGIDPEEFILWLPNVEAEAEERADVLQVEIDSLEERVETLEKEIEEYEVEDLVQNRVSAMEAFSEDVDDWIEILSENQEFKGLFKQQVDAEVVAFSLLSDDLKKLLVN